MVSTGPAVCSGTATRKGCGAPILWVATVNGKMQPLDLDPNPDGNIRLIDTYRQTERGVLQKCRVIPKAELAGSLFGDDEPRYMPHHATCPHAEQFRRPKKAS